MKLSEIDWGELRARIITQTGWSWEYVGEHVTLPRLQVLMPYWSKNPPGRGLEAMLGLGGLGPAPAEPQEEGSLEDLISCWTAAGGAMG